MEYQPFKVYLHGFVGVAIFNDLCASYYVAIQWEKRKRKQNFLLLVLSYSCVDFVYNWSFYLERIIIIVHWLYATYFSVLRATLQEKA